MWTRTAFGLEDELKKKITWVDIQVALSSTRSPTEIKFGLDDFPSSRLLILIKIN